MELAKIAVSSKQEKKCLLTKHLAQDYSSSSDTFEEKTIEVKRPLCKLTGGRNSVMNKESNVSKTTSDQGCILHFSNNSEDELFHNTAKKSAINEPLKTSTVKKPG